MKHVVCVHFILKLAATDYSYLKHICVYMQFYKRVYIFCIIIDLVFFEAAGETKGSAGFGIKLS